MKNLARIKILAIGVLSCSMLTMSSCSKSETGSATTPGSSAKPAESASQASAAPASSESAPAHAKSEGGSTASVKANSTGSSPIRPSVTWERKSSLWALDETKKALEANKETMVEIRKALDGAQTASLPEELRSAHSKTGFVPFSRAVTQFISRKTPPTAAEAKLDQLSVSLAADEWEGVQFGVWALESLKEFSYKVSDLVHQDGQNKISSENIRIYYGHNVIYPEFGKNPTPADGDVVRAVPGADGMNARTNQGRKPKALKGWKESPSVLLDLASVDLNKDEATACWIDVYAPAGTVGGEYKANVALNIAGKEVAQIPLKVTVHPFTLEHFQEWGRGAFISKPRNREELIQMREHGMNIISAWWSGPDETITLVDGKIKADFSQYQQYLKLLDELGFSGPHMVFLGGSTPKIQNRILELLNRPLIKDARTKGNGAAFEQVDLSPPFEEHFVSVLKQFHAQMKEVGHGDLPACLLDEPDHEPRPQRRDFYLKVYAMAEKGAPEIPYYGVFYHEGDEDRLSHHHAAWCSNRPAKKIAEMCQKAGKKLWTYGFGFPYIAGMDRRFSLGIVPWIFDAQSSYVWANYWHKGNVFDPLTVEELSTMGVPAPDGPLPTISLKAIRENVDDGRYLRMLEKSIAAAKNGSSAAKAEAEIHEKFVDSLKKPMFEKLSVIGGKPMFKSVEGLEIVNLQGEKLVFAEDTDAYVAAEFIRKDVINRIVSLHAKMKG